MVLIESACFNGLQLFNLFIIVLMLDLTSLHFYFFDEA